MKRHVVLVPLDGSDAALAAVPLAAALARATGSGIELVATLGAPCAAAAGDDIEAIATAGLAHQLQAVADRLCALGLAVETHVVHGDPTESVLVHAEKRRVAAVVLSGCPYRRGE